MTDTPVLSRPGSIGSAHPAAPSIYPSLAGRRPEDTILLVDDEPAILNVMRITLQSAGHRVLVASSAEEALRLSESYPGMVGMVITDVMLPGLRGPALYQRLRQRYPHLRGLLVSGVPVEVLDDHGIDTAGVDLLLKPWALQQFLDTVRSLLAE
jgi:DNA-binding response OmpR family regulator